MDKKVKLRVQGLTNSQIQSGAYALILAEETGMRRIPIIVGIAEAQSIAIALEQIKPPRPLTHDLFVSFARSYDIALREVFIYKFEDGVFYSELIFDREGTSVILDSRTSDAIAIALRVGCDIYTSEEIIKECGVIIEEDMEAEEEEDELQEDYDPFLPNPKPEPEPEDMNEAELKTWLGMQDREELLERLNEAIAHEKYEFAKIYKDELRRREESGNII